MNIKQIFPTSDLYDKYSSELNIHQRLYGMLIPKDSLGTQLASEDILVHKILKVTPQCRILTPIIKEPVMFEELVSKHKDDNIMVSNYSKNFYYLNSKGVHSIPDNTITIYPHFKNHFIFRAIIPKGSRFIQGLDAYNRYCNVIMSDILLIPKIEIFKYEDSIIVKQLCRTFKVYE